MTIVIQKYLADFHDGSLINIEHMDRTCVFSLESAEIDGNTCDGIALSEQNTIKGKLHLNEIQTISINGQTFCKKLKMLYDYGSIFDLVITDKRVELQVSWRNAPKKIFVNDFSTIIVNAGSIWWETIPDLYDPFW